MKQRLLFEGEVGEDIEDVFPQLIRKAIEINEDVFLRWNGATVRIGPKDTPDTLMAEYEKQIGLISLAGRMEAPIDGREKHLYRINNKLGEFYIVARSFDEAADELMNRLDKADYGFTSYRTVPSIEHLAVQHFNYNNGKQSFSDSEANLIIVEGLA